MATVNDIIVLLNEYKKIIKVVQSKELDNKEVFIEEIIKSLKKYNKYDINDLNINDSKISQNSNVKKDEEKQKIEKLFYLFDSYKQNSIDEISLNSIKEESDIIYKFIIKEIDLEKLVTEYNLEELNMFELRFIYYLLFKVYITRSKKELISSINKSISRVDFYKSFNKSSI